MGIRFGFGIGIFKGISTTDGWAEVILLLKINSYKGLPTDGYIKSIHSFISKNSELLFIDKQEIVFENEKYLVFLYDQYEVESILEMAFKSFSYGWNLSNDGNFLYRSGGMSKVGWRYVVLFKSEEEYFKTTLQNIFLDTEFLDYSMRDLDDLKEKYGIILQKLANYHVPKEEFEYYQTLHQIFENIAIRMQDFYDWMADWTDDIPNEKKNIIFDDLLNKAIGVDPAIINNVKERFGKIELHNDRPDEFVEFYKCWIDFLSEEFNNVFKLKDYDLLYFLNSLVNHGNPSMHFFVNKDIYRNDKFEAIYKYIITPLRNVKPIKTFNQLEKIQYHLKNFINKIDYIRNNLNLSIKESIEYSDKMKKYFSVPLYDIRRNKINNYDIIKDLWVLGDTEKEKEDLCLDLTLLVQLVPNAVNYLKQKTGLFMVSKSDYLLNYYLFGESGELYCYPRRSIIDYWKIDVISSIYEVIEKKMNNVS